LQRVLAEALVLLVVVALVLVPGRALAVDFKLKLPTGLQEDATEIPDDNPISPEKVALGKKFYWDKRWSASKTVACVSCHRPDHGWSDPRTFSTDFAGKPTPRHAPTIVNRLFSDRQHWSGLRASLEERAGLDVNKTDEKVVAHLGTIPAYRQEFWAVFGRDLDPEGVAQAIATYVRTIVSGNSPYDRFQAGDPSAMSVAAQRGLRLFEDKAMCVRCHAGFNFTGEGYRNIGVGMNRPNPDLGRYVITKDDADRGAFKTPTLRDVAKRGPYMHDGSERTLADVIAFYNRGGVKNPWLSSDMKPLGLTAQEQADLVEFMKALTGQIDPEVSRPPRLPE
jgi:cytochrome c peroxidase